MVITKEEMAAGFSERLKDSLFAMGQSQSDLARSIGASATAISTYLKGRLPEAHLLLAIAQSLNIEVQWLLTGEGPMRRGEEKVTSGGSEFDVPGGLSAAEARLVALFRRLTKVQKGKMPNLMSFLATEEQEEFAQEVEELKKELEKETG